MSATPVRALCAALFFAMAVPVTATAGSACAPTVRDTADGWRRAAAPKFAAGGPGVVSYAVDPDDPDTVYAANAYATARSTDGGCTWSDGYVVPETPTAAAPFDQDTADIVGLVAGTQRVYVVLRDVSGPRIVVSKDGGRTWSLTSLTATQVVFGARPPKLAADATGMHAYLLTDVSGGILGEGAGETLWATSDGGGTWTARQVSDSATTVSNSSVQDVGVDPLSGNDVWVTSTVGLVHSTDGGATWEQIHTIQEGALLSVVHRKGQPLQVAVSSSYEAIVRLRGAAGGWTTVNTPGLVTSLAGGRGPTQAAITTDSGLYELSYASLTWRPIHRGNPALYSLMTDNTTSPSYFACACGDDGSLWSRDPRAVDKADLDAVDRRGVDDNADPSGTFPGYFGCAPNGKHRKPAPDLGPSVIAPSGNEITLPPGGSVTVPYRLRVRPRELDVYFLTDSGPRSIDFGCTAKQGSVWAADELARRHALRVGAGEYRDFPRGQNLYAIISPNCFTRPQDDFVYRRNLRIGIVDDVFRQGVADTGAYGTCTGDFAGLTALLQTATGAGMDVAPKGSSAYDIRAGQQAGFAPAAYKVVVHVTSGWMENPTRTPGYPGPDFSEVIDALASRGIKQVGVYVPADDKKYHGTDPRPVESGQVDLVRVARGTDTLAERDVTCSKKLKAYVHRGEPLVCTFDWYSETDGDPSNGATVTEPPMGRQIADLVGSFTDVRPMRLAVLAGDGVVSRLAPEVPSRRDYLLPQTLGYSVTYRCGQNEFGSSKQVQIGGLVGNDVVATATTTVRCGTPPPLLFRPRVAVVPPVPVPVHVGAPVGNPVPNPNPAPNPATQPQAQSQQVAQGVAVPQEQSQPQLAFAHETTTEQVGTQYEMSALRTRSREPVPRWLLGEVAGLLTCAAAVFAFAGRTQWARDGRRAPR